MAVADISTGKPKGKGLLGFLETVSPFVPIVGGVVNNVLEGMNNRRARKYNLPINQVRRMKEAGLPLAAGSSIEAGGGVATNVQQLGTENFGGNLQNLQSIHASRKEMQILDQELRARKADADIKEGERDWLLQERPNFIGPTNNNQAAMNDLSRSIKESQNIMSENQQMISGIEREVKEELRDKGYLTKETINRVDLMFKQIGLIGQQTTALNDSRQARKVLLELLNEGGMSWWEAIGYMLLTKNLNSGQ